MPKWIDNTYLGKLFHLDRKLSFWVAGFFFLTVCCNLFRLEVTPFFVWGMYSAVEKPQSIYPVSWIKVNDTTKIDLYTGVSDNSRFFLFSPLQYYKELKENNDFDAGLGILRKKFPSSDFYQDKSVVNRFKKSAELRKFGSWYAKYIATLTGQQVNSLRVKNFQAKFSPEGNLLIDSGHVFLQWP